MYAIRSYYASSGATAVSFRKANLALKVKPQITPDGNIIMTLDVNKDAPGSTTPAGVQISTKHVKTEVLVENGGTVVIGGIYTAPGFCDEYIQLYVARGLRPDPLPQDHDEYIEGPIALAPEEA